MKKMYRCEPHIIYGTSTLNDNFEVRYHKYIVIKETPSAYWVKSTEYYSKPKWFGKYSKKRFARETKEEALKDFIIRNDRRIEYLKSSIFECEKFAETAEKELKKIK